MANTTNYNWETPDDTDLVKDGAAAIRTLGSSIDTTTKNLNPETTTGDIAYRSATANVNTRLGLGTAGQVLRVNSGATAPEWATTADQTPLTTKGDLFTFSTVDARLAVGANGTTLVADSAEATGLKWAAPAGATFVGCSLYKSAAQSIANDSSTTITWDSENYDTDSLHSTVTNTSRITIPTGKGGKWLFTGCMAFASNGTKVRRANLVVNGTTSYLPIAQQATAATDGDSTHGTFAWPLNLVAGDYVEMQAYQNSGGSLDFKTASVFTATYLGA